MAITLDPNHVGRDSSRFAEEVIAHLVGLVGSSVTVTLEIEAELPEESTAMFDRLRIAASRLGRGRPATNASNG